MNFSAMTVSFPLDEETYQEVEALCQAAAETDSLHYEQLLNLPVATSYESKGFFVLVYDDKKNTLAGVCSAIDVMGLNTYEWSLVVAPMYRGLALGEALYSVMREGLDVRGSEGDLALMLEGSPNGLKFLKEQGYLYSFSEASLEAKASNDFTREDLTFRAFQPSDVEALVEIFATAFGDVRDESLQLIEFNTTTPGLQLWSVELNKEVVATVTTRKDGEMQWITALAVHADHMGKGIGTAILQWVKQYTLKNDEKFVMLDVELDNKQALAIYEKAGFMKALQVDYFVRAK